MKMTISVSFSAFRRNACRLSALVAAFVATNAFADLYWACDGSTDTYFSSVNNWSDDRNGTGGVGRPGLDTGHTYFCKLKNGSTLFDEAAVVSSNVAVGIQSSSTFVWRVADPSYGVSSSSGEFQVGAKIANYSRTPTYFRVEGGTYSFNNSRIGYDTGSTTEFLLQGGSVTCANYTYIGAANGATATLTLDGGAYTSKYARIGGNASANATLEVKSGSTFRTTSTGSEALQIGYATNTTASIIVNGGTLDNVGYIAMGFYKDSTTLINVKSGQWTAGGIRIGAKANKATNYVDNAVSRIVIDGGNVAWTNASYMAIGNTIGEGSYGELVVNGGTVNCNASYFYVAETGPATFTMNGGKFTMTNTGNGYLTIGHQKTGSDVGQLNLNGGELAVRKLRIDYAQPGSKVVFNGGTLKPIKSGTDFIDANANFTCEVQGGGMVIDTDGHNITIAHDIVLASGVSSAPLIKKGVGTLTLTGTTPFSEENVFVYEGSVSMGGIAYGVNIGDITDASAGGDLGEVVLHGEPLESWLKDPDFMTYTSTYGAAGTASLEQPLTITMSVNGALKRYSNLETGKTYSDTLNGVSYSFTTEDLPPRTLQVVAPDGSLIKNVRDVGSWPLVSANGTAKMNQGVIFRGATLDAFANATAAQKAASALADLKSEIDLRTIGVDSSFASAYQNATKSWAAVDADYIYCPINYNNGGSQIDSDDNGNFTNQVRRMFSRLGTEGALPAYFHCAIGTDRTGITGLLLLGLMGVEEETLYRDYLMSNFANIGSSRSASVPEKFIRYMLRGDCNSNKYVYRNNAYGATVAGRARAYLEMCGVTTAEIANITQALSGETPDQVLARVDAWEAANNVRTVSYVPLAGSSTTNATHRLPAGTHILPLTNPTRTGYIFAGWDTEHEADGFVYANWDPVVPHHWVGPSGASESFFRADAWDPALDGGVFEPDDVLVLNRGNDKTALLSEGTASVQTLYVGWGSNDGGRTTSTSYDHGGRLDMTGGTLNVTNLLYIGGYRSPYSNIVNVAGGSLVMGALRMGDYYDSKSNGKWDVLNISGNGVVSNTTGEVQTSIRSSGSRSRIDISGNGTFVSRQNVKLGTAAAGKSVVSMEDNGTANLSGKNLYLTYGSGATAELSMDDSSTLLGVYDMTIGYSASSTGTVTVAGTSSLSVSHYIYLGRQGEGELTINGGTVLADSTVQFGIDGKSGNSTVLNLNGGKLVTRQLKVLGSPNAVINWNGGTLECSTYSYADGNMIPANANLQINVLQGGAVYSAVVLDNEEIKQAMSGVGALTKKGNKPLTVSGAVDLDGGYIVEEGTLTLTNVTGTEFKKISVAEGASLDLNGAEVTVEKYVLNGVKQPRGTYTAHNGTIHVNPPVVGTTFVVY